MRPPKAAKSKTTNVGGKGARKAAPKPRNEDPDPRNEASSDDSNTNDQSNPSSPLTENTASAPVSPDSVESLDPAPNAHRRKQAAPTRKLLKTIVNLQLQTTNIIPMAPFSRVVREIMQKSGEFKITVTAMKALQESSEVYLTQLFTDANAITSNRGQVTVALKDIHLVMFLRGPNAQSGRMGG